MRKRLAVTFQVNLGDTLYNKAISFVAKTIFILFNSSAPITFPPKNKKTQVMKGFQGIVVTNHACLFIY